MKHFFNQKNKTNQNTNKCGILIKNDLMANFQAQILHSFLQLSDKVYTIYAETGEISCGE